MSDHTQLYSLLGKLKVALPEVNLSDLEMEKMLEWNTADFEGQYKTDCISLAFWTMLLEQTRDLERGLKDELTDVENTLWEEKRAAMDTAKPTAERIKNAVHRDQKYIDARNKLRTIQGKISTIEAVYEPLQRKWTALTMIASRENKLLQAGMGEHHSGR